MPIKIVADPNIPFVQQCFSHLGSVRLIPGRQMTRQDLRDAQVLLVRSVTRVDQRLLDGTSIRFVGTATIGFEHVDIDYLNSRGIAFASAPGSNANSVAEYVVAALLELGQRYEMTLKGRSIGIVGVGNVGSLVARKCKALGMNVLLNDPPLARSTGDLVYRPIEELYDCDILTFHVPLTFTGQDKTFHLIDGVLLDSLRPGVILINTSRGAVHDTDALKHAKVSGKLKAFVLDVWENEPNVDPELLDMADIATSHIAGYSLDGKVEGMVMIYRKVCESLGQDPVFEASDFLPEPEVDSIKLDDGLSEQQQVTALVRRVYPILRDDQNMRKLLKAPPQLRAGIFDAIRRDYPDRREFHNTTVFLGSSQSSIAKVLEGIGFRVKVINGNKT